MSAFRSFYDRGPGVPFGFHVTWTRTVKWLMGVNLAVFVFQLMLSREGLLRFWDLCAMDPRQVFSFPPRLWQLVTYMFLHGGVGHLLGNMIGLFFFAGDVERELGTKRFLRFYVACGVTGALLSCVLDVDARLVGASAGVLGVVVAFAVFYPNVIVYLWMLILIPVRAKHLAGAFAIVNLLLAMEGRARGIAYWGHVGGIAYAFTYLWLWPRLGWSVRLPRWFSLAGWSGRWREGQRRRDARRRADVQEELDRILAKVHQEGLPSLTEAERQFLNKVSKRYGGDER